MRIKVKCINLDKLGGKDKYTLTMGKIYDAIKPEKPVDACDIIFIINDLGIQTSYFRYRFLFIEEHREQQLKNIGI